MAITRVTFGEWLPDQPGVIGALTTAKNCYPRAVGYGPFPTEEDYSDAAAQNLTNVVAGRDTSGNTQVFASGTTRIYRLDSSDFSLDDVSATTYTGATMWKFTQFGNKVIGASEAHTMQAYDLTTTANFANLSSDAPKAKFVTVCVILWSLATKPTTKTECNGRVLTTKQRGLHPRPHRQTFRTFLTAAGFKALRVASSVLFSWTEVSIGCPTLGHR